MTSSLNPNTASKVYSEEYLQFVVNHIQFGSAASSSELLPGSLAIRTLEEKRYLVPLRYTGATTLRGEALLSSYSAGPV